MEYWWTGTFFQGILTSTDRNSGLTLRMRPKLKTRLLFFGVPGADLRARSAPADVINTSFPVPVDNSFIAFKQQFSEEQSWCSYPIMVSKCQVEGLDVEQVLAELTLEEKVSLLSGEFLASRVWRC